MRLWMAFIALLPACGWDAPAATGDGGHTDGPPDAPQLCFGTFARVCFNTLADVPTDAKNLSAGADIDTDSQVQTVCDQHNDRKGDFCVIAGKGFVLPTGQVLRAHGSKPLVLISTDTMMLEATSMVDVSSTRLAAPQDRGAGANPSSCVAGMSPVMAGGGYGGSFGGKGGDGERLGSAPATSGNAAPAVSPAPTMLRGGCAGGDGDSTGGAGGAGGGAVAFIATSIQLLGTVNASGAGGHGAPATKSGGGGGGSGGMIVIESPSITATGLLFANGGGGGQGGTGGGTPVVGADGGESNAPGTGAIAGASATEGGNGGVGSSGPSKSNGFPAQGGASGMGGGGGGGGGAGFIRGHGLPMAANVFPVAIDLP